MRGGFVGAIALALVIGAGARFAAAEGGVNWVADMDAAKKAAAEQHRLILANFWAEW